MPTLLPLDRHLAGLHEATHRFVAHAGRAGLEAPVPTCPDWAVLDLVAHLGMVHRWAAALLRGERPDSDEVARYDARGRSAADPLAWLAEGALEVATAVTAASESLEALVFLLDAPPTARAFWARRQCHETTMHAVDALAASLGRAPRAEEVELDPELAADGIDELLGGFLTRPRSRLRCDEDGLLVVRPVDMADWWQVALGPRPALTTRGGADDLAPADPDWELTGTAAELYLRLWNRLDPPEEWRRLTAVGWT